MPKSSNRIPLTPIRPHASNDVVSDYVPAPRALSEIAREIVADWPRVAERGEGPFNIGQHPAAPYVQAMGQLPDTLSNFYQDSAVNVVRYFLANAGQWRGETARRVKAELRAMLP